MQQIKVVAKPILPNANKFIIEFKFYTIKWKLVHTTQMSDTDEDNNRFDNITQQALDYAKKCDGMAHYLHYKMSAANALFLVGEIEKALCERHLFTL